MHKWLNVDLHTHSYYSKEYDPNRVKEMDTKTFVDTLIAKGVNIFSITDHNTFSSKYFKEILEYIKGKDIQAIPGCEFNIYIEKSDNKKFQANFYFTLDTNFEKLESTIEEIYKNNNKPLFSEIIENLNKQSFSFMIFPEADKTGGINKVFRKICSIGEMDRYLKNGMQRIFKGYDSSDGFDKVSADMWALSYFKTTEEYDSIFQDMSDDRISEITQGIVNKLKSNVSPLGEDADLINNTAKMITQYGNCFSYFHFSDWHNKSEYDPKFKNYIFGNLSLPFESVELAVLDPVSRVNVIKYEEKLVEPMNNIKKISFAMNKQKFEINFEVGLNAIVGKRASGKSLLMAILLKLYNKDDSKLSKYKNTYIIDLDSIECETFEGQKLKIGQLVSLEYIEQDTISSIFNDPTISDNGIKKYFLELEEVDLSYFDELLIELKKLKQYDKNYKSVTSFLMNSLLRKIDSPVILAIAGGIFAFTYSWTFILPNYIVYHIDPIAYLVSDLLFEGVLAVCGFVSTFILYKPCSKLFDKLQEPNINS